MSVLETEAVAPVVTVAPRRLPKVATASAVLRDLFLVTWSAPLDKLQTLVPAGTVLERLPNLEGEPVGFVQLVFALRSAARWSLLPSQLGEDYHETTLQILTRNDGERSAFVIAHFVDNAQVVGSFLPVSRVVEDARYSVYVAGDPARQTFTRMGLKLTTHAVQIHVRAEACSPPERTLAGSWSDSVAFFSRLGQRYHPARLPREGQSLLREEHPPLSPLAALLTHQLVRPFDSLELGAPILALYQAELPVTNLPIKRK